MKILALETSAKSVSAAVVENDIPLAWAYQDTGLTHSRTLMPLVDGMLKSADLTLDKISLLAVAAGPGSFTGLRIGVSAAKGLAWTLDLPCCGVSTLEAMAENLRHVDGVIICAMDARRNQIYNAVFEAAGGHLIRRAADRAISLEELVAELKNEEKKKFLVGDGACVCYTYLEDAGITCTMAPPTLRMQNALGVAQVAARMAAQGKTVSAQELTPCYLRLSQAERERMAKGLPLSVNQ